MAVVHERWLQRVNATETTGGIAVSTANDASAPLFCWTHRHMIAETTCCAHKMRAHALNHGGAID
jgi:hypothetical protein